MRSILLHVHEDDCMEARLQAALDMARQFDARLTCVQVAPYELGVPGDFYGAMVAQLAVEYERDAEEVRARFEKRIADEDVRWKWIQSLDSATKIIARYAPTRDLLILGAHNPAGEKDRPSRLQSVTEPLLNATLARNGAFLVMGAYGHSRFRERILGGVTRDMLTDPKIPLLLSH